MESQIIQTGLLAYGMSGQVFHAPFIHHHAGFNLCAVVERHQKNAQKDYPAVISYNRVDELLADKEIELVIVNTPNFTHFNFAKQALQAGKHVLVEKPFTATVAEAEALLALANRVGKQVFVYQNRRYDSGFNAFKNVLQGNRLGKLVEVHFRFDRYRNEISPKAFKEEPMPASGLLYDLGPHLLDQAISLFGKPENFYKTTSINRTGSKVDDFFHLHLVYADLNVFITSSMLVPSMGPSFIAHGAYGSFSKNFGDVQEDQLKAGMPPTDERYGVEKAEDAGLLTVVTERNGREALPVVAPKGDYMLLFDALYQSLVKGIPFPIKNSDILIQLSILES